MVNHGLLPCSRLPGASGVRRRFSTSPAADLNVSLRKEVLAFTSAALRVAIAGPSNLQTSNGARGTPPIGPSPQGIRMAPAATEAAKAPELPLYSRSHSALFQSQPSSAPLQPPLPPSPRKRSVSVESFHPMQIILPSGESVSQREVSDFALHQVQYRPFPPPQTATTRGARAAALGAPPKQPSPSSMPAGGAKVPPSGGADSAKGRRPSSNSSKAPSSSPSPPAPSSSQDLPSVAAWEDFGKDELSLTESLAVANLAPSREPKDAEGEMRGPAASASLPTSEGSRGHGTTATSRPFSSTAAPGKGRSPLLQPSCCRSTAATSPLQAVWNLAPRHFAAIRALYGISDECFGRSVSEIIGERFSEGSSGAFMCLSRDSKYIIKTLSSGEAEVLKKLLPHLLQHLTEHPQSLIVKFYACMGLQLYKQRLYFVVMENLFPLGLQIQERFDLKGSWIDRSSLKPRQRHGMGQPQFDPLRISTTLDGEPIFPKQVLKDSDLKYRLAMPAHVSRLVAVQLQRDVDFLARYNIMDYSLLLGVHRSQFQRTFTALQDLEGPQPGATDNPSNSSSNAGNTAVHQWSPLVFDTSPFVPRETLSSKTKPGPPGSTTLPEAGQSQAGYVFFGKFGWSDSST